MFNNSPRKGMGRSMHEVKPTDMVYQPISLERPERQWVSLILTFSLHPNFTNLLSWKGVEEVGGSKSLVKSILPLYQSISSPKRGENN